MTAAGDPADPTLYELLGVSSTAEAATIDATYKRHLQRLRPGPDTPADERAERVAQAKRLRAAQRVLVDPAARAAYDASLAARQAPPTAALEPEPEPEVAQPEPQPAPAAPPEPAAAAADRADPEWRPPRPPASRGARIAAGAGALVGPLCLVSYVSAFVARDAGLAVIWAVLSGLFGALMWSAGPAFPRTGRGHRAVVARTAFAAGLSPLVGIISVPAMLKAAFGPSAAPPASARRTPSRAA